MRRTTWPTQIIPGFLNVRKTRTGIRWGIGPRICRLHVGGGKTTWSTGFGPWTWTTKGR